MESWRIQNEKNLNERMDSEDLFLAKISLVVWQKKWNLPRRCQGVGKFLDTRSEVVDLIIQGISCQNYHSAQSSQALAAVAYWLNLDEERSRYILDTIKLKTCV